MFMKEVSLAFLFVQKKHQSTWVVLVLLVGLLLRLYQLADDPFWLDEIGVWEAATQPTFTEAVGVSRSHVMGMPLHYALTWLFAQTGLQNEWLRLPDAILGTISIALGYAVACYFVRPQTATLTALLMATSPLLVRYSQELRFYAGLLFFYFLILWTALRAFEKPRWQRWLTVVLAGAVGTLFHTFTILGLGSAFAVFLVKTGWRRWKAARRLIVCSIVLLIFYAWAVIEFGSVPAVGSALFAFETPWQFLLRGFGMAPIHSPNPGSLVYYLILWGMSGLGLIKVVQNKDLPLLSSLIAGFLMIALVLSMNWYRHYFVHSRQIYFLSFWVFILASSGLSSTVEWVEKRLTFLSINWRSSVSGSLIVLVIGLVSLPALSQYYAAERTIARSGYATMLHRWQPGDWICVLPDYDAIVYIRHWQKSVGAWVIPCTVDEVYKREDVRFVLASQSFDLSSHFHLIFTPAKDTLFPKWIWMRGK